MSTASHHLDSRQTLAALALAPLSILPPPIHSQVLISEGISEQLTEALILRASSECQWPGLSPGLSIWATVMPWHLESPHPLIFRSPWSPPRFTHPLQLHCLITYTHQVYSSQGICTCCSLWEHTLHTVPRPGHRPGYSCLSGFGSKITSLENLTLGQSRQSVSIYLVLLQEAFYFFLFLFDTRD